MFELDLLNFYQENSCPTDPELAAEGWERRFMAHPNRVEEAVQLYTEMGFEVRVEPTKPSEFNEGCDECRLADCINFLTIYTRRSFTKT